MCNRKKKNNVVSKEDKSLHIFLFLIVGIYVFTILFLLINVIICFVNENKDIKDIDIKSWLNLFLPYLSTFLINTLIIIFNVKISRSSLKLQREINKQDIFPLIRLSIKDNDSFDVNKNIYNSLVLVSNYFINKNIIRKLLVIKNVGKRELYDLHIRNIRSNFNAVINSSEIAQIVYKDDTVFLNLEIDCNDIKDSFLEFNLYYKDCHSNKYYQHFKINLNVWFIEVSTPKDVLER